MLQWNTGLRTEIAPKIKPLWRLKRRYKGLRGGRGSGKSHGIADYIVCKTALEHVRGALMREVQVSIRDSAKLLIEDKIHSHGMDHLFHVTDREISCPSTDSLLIFRGLQNHTVSSIKSLEGFNLAWYEEAQTLSQRSIELATPTFRGDAEQMFSWNPEEETDPVDVLFLSNLDDPDFWLETINYDDNPWWDKAGLKSDMERDRRRDPDKYNHIWRGGYRKNSASRVFKHVRSQPFITPDDAMFLHGADFGFSNDPTVLVRCFPGRLDRGVAVYDPDGLTLFIDAEAYQVGCEIRNTASLFDGLDPDNSGSARKWQIRADSARPETISHLKGDGYPLIVPATKGPGSIVEGVSFLQNYDVVIHPRCTHSYDEWTSYSYKVDPKTKAVTNVLADEKNHVIDAARYAVEDFRKAVKVNIGVPASVPNAPPTGSSEVPVHLSGSFGEVSLGNNPKVVEINIGMPVG